MNEKIKLFAELLEKETREKYAREYPGTPQNSVDIDASVHIKPGKKYVKIDVGTSGKYMIDESGAIWGIKAYGVIHHGHQYGTLDTINAWSWGGYTARLKTA
jgi:hypothetical protein